MFLSNDSERQMAEEQQKQHGPSLNGEPFDLLHETKLLFHIAVPSVAIQLCIYFIFTQTAAAVGTTLGSEELAGFSLGSLVGNLTCLSVMVGALTAADTLMPRAYGSKDYREVGRLAIRGYLTSLALLCIPAVPLMTCMEWIFVKLGQDPIAAAFASEWIRVYLAGLPFVLFFRVMRSFLNAQHRVWPLFYTSAITCFGLQPFLLKRLLPAIGFVGSGLAIVVTQMVTALLLWLYVKCIKDVYHPETWPALTREFFQESLQPGPVWRFLHLSLGGVLALSEWWFWETVCFIAGSFGIIPLCVHTIAYNLIPLVFMVPLGTGIALTVRMGNILAYDVPRAKRLAAFTMLFISIVGGIICSLSYIFQSTIIRFFTNDPLVIQGCKEIWPKVCYYLFVLHIFGINVAIMRALGLQWRMAAIVVGWLWCGTILAIVEFAVRRGGHLSTLWTILPLSYTLMQFLLVISYGTVDWTQTGKDIRERSSNNATSEKNIEEGDVAPATETTRLVGGNGEFS